MPNVLEIDLASMRRLWRTIPSEALDRQPDVVSRVFLDPDGGAIALSRLAGGWFSVPMPGGAASFERLADAELFAAGALAEREGVPS